MTLSPELRASIQHLAPAVLPSALTDAQQYLADAVESMNGVFFSQQWVMEHFDNYMPTAEVLAERQERVAMWQEVVAAIEATLAERQRDVLQGPLGSED